MTDHDSRQRRPHGALKATVLDILLRRGEPMSAQQVRQSFPEGAQPALTTVLTVLDRLRQSGEVERTQSPDGEHEFRPTATDSRDAAVSMLDTLLRSNDRSGALLSFAGSLDATDVEVLRQALEARSRKQR